MRLTERDRAAIEGRMRELNAAKARRALPGLFAGATFEADDGGDPSSLETCRRFVDGFDRLSERGLGLVLYGPVGTGKTWRAAQVANALMAGGKSVVFSSMTALERDMRADYGRGAYEVEARLKGASLAVLDDLGVERATPAMAEAVLSVVECLRQSRTPAIFTTNNDPASMLADGDQMHARIYSRIMEVCRAVRIDGQDRRRASARRNAALFDEVLGKR